MNHKHWQEDPWVPEPDGEVLDLEPSDYELTDPTEPPESNVEEAELEDSDDSVFGQFRQKIGSAVTDAIKGLPTLPEFSGINQAIRDGQQEVYNLYRRLSPLEEYASAYMDASWSLDGTGRVPFGRVLVGSRGVTPNANSFVLNDFGLWKIDAQIWPSWWLTSAGSDVAFEIRVLRPNGSIYHRKLTRTEGRTADHPLAVSTSVVVPDVGYRVEAVITSISPGRGLQGGSDKTHLIVHHINREKPSEGDTTGQN